MFDSLKKASIQLMLDTDVLIVDGKISGTIHITPSENFDSNSLEIQMNWKDQVFVNEKPFIRRIQDSQSYQEWKVETVNFCVDFVSKMELESCYDQNNRRLELGEQNHDAFWDEVHSKWRITAYFDIPGLDVSDTIETTVKSQ